MKLSKSLLLITTIAIWFPAGAYAASSTAKSELAEALDGFSSKNFSDIKAGSVGYAVLHGTPWIDVRYRYESVDQDGFAQDAYASTVRTKIGYKTDLWQGFQLGGEFENIVALGVDHYNSTTNGKTQFPTITDPEDSDVNQLYISYQGLPKTNVTIGRQLIRLDNERFVGESGWRQNNQTFDAASIFSQYFDKTSLYYAYVSKVNRITGPSAINGAYDSNSHLFNASYEFMTALKLTVYDYALDFADAASLSSNTYGVRATGKYDVGAGVSLLYVAEFASQSDYADNTANYSENYYFIEPGASWNGFTGKLGYEVLAGDGTSSVQTPIASLHAVNGWADKFTTTPVNGLEDRYVSLAYKVPFGNQYINGTEFVVAYHDFQAEHIGSDYGTEWDASIQQTFYDHYVLGLKFADYNADALFADTTKAMATVTVKY